jgi:hypothetical protein
MKKQWRAELNKYKDWCVANNVRNVTIPKDKYGGLLAAMLSNNKINNRDNIVAGFRACGIIPFNPNMVLSRLPPEEGFRRDVQNEFDRQLTEELKRNRYGEPTKSKRAKKANRLPPGTSYTVSAVDGGEEEGEAEPQPGPSGESLRQRTFVATTRKREASHLQAGKQITVTGTFIYFYCTYQYLTHTGILKSTYS